MIETLGRSGDESPLYSHHQEKRPSHSSMSRPTDLPEFDRPPLSEVALSIQFDQLVGLSPLKMAAAWDLFRSRFPKDQIQRPLAAAFETFGPAPVPFPPISFEMGVPPLRYWFLDESEKELIQIQNDRFVHNWRKLKSEDVYPRYEAMRGSFVEEFSKFTRWADTTLGARIAPNQCELTYVNLISIPSGNSWRRINEVFSAWSPVESSLQFEDARFAVRLVIRNEVNEPVGRLHISVDPMTHVQDGEVLQMTLTARGAPSAPTVDASMAFFDAARAKISETFLKFTTTEMHKVWGRTR
ncbi:MAG: TIGR04255 family protein [Alphaproteobacteria bacterium]|nr:TIGR04255 family protein [Alphaproteobacteria bacterium]